MDMSDFLMNMIDEPEAVNHLLEICTQQSARFAMEQIEAGAKVKYDNIIKRKVGKNR